MHVPRLALLAAGGVFLLFRVIRRDPRQQVPFTGRKHAVMVPESIERALGETTFAKLLASKRRLPDSSPEAQRCSRLGAAIIRAALVGDGKGGFTDHLKDLAWKVVVVDDDQINACALPGGKIVINSGLVRRFADDEAALAFVIAHEVGHVLARHSAEQLTLQGATQLLAMLAQGVAMAAAAAAAASGRPGVPMPRGPTKEEAEGLGSLLEMGLFRPRSREQEFEADHIGVELCRRAGLGDGSAAIAVFKCFDALEAAAAGPLRVKAFSFLSTHPTPSERAQKVAVQCRAGGLDAIAAARGGGREEVKRE